MIFRQEQTHPFLDQSNKTSRVFPALKLTNHFLRQSTVSCRSDSILEANSSCCHRSDTWSIISIESNITDNIIRKVINVLKEKCRTINGALRNSNINWIFLWRLPIQNHLKSSISEKRRNKAKYLTWSSIRLKFVKKTNMPNPVKSLGYVECFSSSSPRLVESASNLPDTTVRKSVVANREDPKPYWKSEKIWRKIYFAVTHLKKIWVGVLKF